MGLPSHAPTESTDTFVCVGHRCMARQRAINMYPATLMFRHVIAVLPLVAADPRALVQSVVLTGCRKLTSKRRLFRSLVPSSFVGTAILLCKCTLHLYNNCCTSTRKCIHHPYVPDDVWLLVAVRRLLLVPAGGPLGPGF